MKTLLMVAMSFLFFNPAENVPVNESSTSEDVRSIRVCWEVLGGEIICVTLEENIKLKEDVMVRSMYDVQKGHMVLSFPTKFSGSLTLAEGASLKLGGCGIKVPKGTKIRVKNGKGRLPLKA